MEETIFTFIRHGSTAGNLEKRYIGKRTEESLCERGIKEILENAAAGKYPPADLVFSSPMRRCLESCSLIYGAENGEPIVVQDFCETDFGDFEGKSYSELKDSLEYRKWLESGGMLPFPGGESREEFASRSLRGFSSMLEAAGLRGEKLLRVSAVVHGGTVMAVLSSLTGKGYYDFQIENGGTVSFKLRFFGGNSGRMEAEILN